MGQVYFAYFGFTNQSVLSLNASRIFFLWVYVLIHFSRMRCRPTEMFFIHFLSVILFYLKRILKLICSFFIGNIM